MTPYRLAIFDVDGTLSDSFPWFLRVVNGIADKHRFKRIEGTDVEALRGQSSRDIVASLGVPIWKLPFIAHDMRKLKSQHLNEIPLFPDVAAMLERLSAAGLLLAVVSSDSEANVRQSLGHAARAISHFGCGVSLFGKAAMFRRVMKRLGAPPSATICIGDEVRDAEAARKAGADFGAVTWGYALPEALQRMQPALIFSDRHDVVRKLTRA